MKSSLRKLYWFVGQQLGFDPLRLAMTLRNSPRFVVDWLRFMRVSKDPVSLFPCLQDRGSEGGVVRNEYFWQDLYVAQKIHAANPQKHVDIGSRVDGFVAHLASFRTVEVIDIRPIDVAIPGVRFRQADVMSARYSAQGDCDSLSCLHALEHFGLGRYGDPIHGLGYALGFANMTKHLRAGGVFYLSVPLGRQRVEFNGQRIFSPKTILKLAEDNSMDLVEFAWVAPERGIVEVVDFYAEMEDFAHADYRLGIFRFVKK